MKKVISIILAITLVFSISGFSFAGTQVLTENTTQTVHLENGETKEFTFIPQSDGVYMLNVEFSNAEKSFAVVHLQITANGEDISWDRSVFYSMEDVSFPNNSDGSRFPAEKGKEITVSLCNYKISETVADLFVDEITGLSYNQPVDIEVTVTKISAQTLEKNKTYTVTEIGCFYVEPQQDETYYIASDSEYMSYLYVATDGESYYNAGSSEDGCTGLVFRLEKGKKYLLFIEFEGDSCTFTVSDGSNVKPKKLELYTGNIPVGSECVIYVDCYPSGSEINSDGFTVTVDNEKLASVYWSEESGCYYIKGLRPGSVKVTVTEKSTGASDEGTFVFLSELQGNLNESIFPIFSLLSKLLTCIYDLFNKLNIF